VDIKKLESRIKKMQVKVKAASGEGSDALLLRAARKRLKRAQRKRQVRLTMIAKVKAQGKKKEEAAS